MRVIVDRTQCQGHAQCLLAAPGVFDLDDEDSRATVLADPVPDGLVESAQEAAERYPERAISVSG
jgi:ferredoxin